MGIYDDLFALPPPGAGSETKTAAIDPQQTGGVYDDLFKTTPDGGKTVPSIRRPGREPEPETDAWSGKLGRFALGAAEPVVGGFQTVSHLMPWGGETMDSVAQAFAQKQAHARKVAGIEEGGWDIPGILGNVAATAAPMAKAVGWASKAPSYLGMMGRGAAAGALGAATDPVKDTSQGYWGQKGENLALGTAAGAGLGVLGETAARAAHPVIDESARWLAERGVKPTIGAIFGDTMYGAGKRAENVLTSLPGVGSVIRDKQTQAIDQSVRGQGKEVLAHIGKDLPDTVATGNPQIEYMKQTLGKEFDDTYRSATLDRDKQFLRERSKLYKDVDAQLTEADAARVDKETKSIITATFAKAGAARKAGAPINGDELQSIITRLKSRETHLANSSSPVDRDVGTHVGKFRELIEDTAARQNPGFGERLDNVSKAWWKFARMQAAAGQSSTIGHGGVYTPTNLGSATARLDPTLRNAATASGQSPLQDWAEHGKKVLRSNVADSGTPERGFLMGLLSGTLPIHWPAALAAGSGLGALYSDPVQNVARKYLLSNSEWQKKLASGIRSATPWGGLAAGESVGDQGEAPRYADGGAVSAGLSELTSQLRQQGVRF